MLAGELALAGIDHHASSASCTGPDRSCSISPHPVASPTQPGYDRISIIDASYTGPWHLPVIGHVPNPHAVLIRPDGHVGWVDTDGTATGLQAALTKWITFSTGNSLLALDDRLAPDRE